MKHFNEETITNTFQKFFLGVCSNLLKTFH